MNQGIDRGRFRDLGSALCKRLLEDGEIVDVLDHPRREMRGRWVDQGGSNPHFGDVTDLKDVRKAVDGVEGVGHLTFMPPLDPRWTQL